MDPETSGRPLETIVTRYEERKKKDYIFIALIASLCLGPQECGFKVNKCVDQVHFINI